MTKPSQPIRLYRFPRSGHAHRVELFLSLLGLPVTLIDVDLTKGAQKQPDFLAKNPFGQVPVIEDSDVTLHDSNAILVYLAGRYDGGGTWLPREPVAAAKVQQWLSVAAGPLASGPALARVGLLFKRPIDLAKAQETARALFAVMNAHLGQNPFLVGTTPTIADIALYTYTALAPEGGIELALYPHIQAWLERIEALPGFVPMLRSAAA
jgi:glutathione S-transferase